MEPKDWFAPISLLHLLLIILGKVLSNKVQEQFFSDVSSNKQILVENHEGALWEEAVGR